MVAPFALVRYDTCRKLDTAQLEASQSLDAEFKHLPLYVLASGKLEQSFFQKTKLLLTQHHMWDHVIGVPWRNLDLQRDAFRFISGGAAQFEEDIASLHLVVGHADQVHSAPAAWR